MRVQLRSAILGLAWTACSSLAPAWADGTPRGSRPDPYAYTPGVALDYNWSGIYFGGHAGGAVAEWRWTVAATGEPIKHNDAGFAGGAQVGLQKQWDWIVVGAEVSYTWTDLASTKPSVFVPGASLTSHASDLLLVTGRLGFAWQHILAYVKGGYANADVSFTRSGVTASKRSDGSVAGLGLEFGVTPNITIGAEYDWVKLNGSANGVIDTSIDVQTLTGRLNFKFGPH